MKKTRRCYDREFKISIIAELESGKTLAQVAREHGILGQPQTCPGKAIHTIMRLQRALSKIAAI
jgi:hypothetical protein